MKTPQADKKKPTFPIKHVQFYHWIFNTCEALSKMAEKLKREHFEMARPTDNDNVLAIATQNRPPALVFIFIQRESKGGDLILLQTSLGKLPLAALEKHLGIIERKAGITILK